MTRSGPTLLAAAALLSAIASSCAPQAAPPPAHARRTAYAVQRPVYAPYSSQNIERPAYVRRSAAAPKTTNVALATPGPAPRPAAPVERGATTRSYIPWGDYSIDTRLADIGPRARSRWMPYFDRAGVSYPPASVEIVTLKRERRVEVYAGPSPGSLRYIRTIAVIAASGGPGPKLREGDRQVPEGVYEIVKLNPNSAYHVSMRLSYPNAFDQEMGARDHRSRLGSDIMIHGGAKSIGCVAVGDLPAEDLFVLSADAGLANVDVVIAPRDFRRTGEFDPLPGQPDWVRDLYAQIDGRLRMLPPPVNVYSSAPGRVVRHAAH